MSFNLNYRITNAIKDYDLTDNAEASPVSFSTEFEETMERFIQSKQRNYKIYKLAQRCIMTVLTIALVGSFLYLLLLQQSEEVFFLESSTQQERSPYDTPSDTTQNDNTIALDDDTNDDFITVEVFINKIYSGEAVCIARVFIGDDVTYSIKVEAEYGNSIFSGLRVSADDFNMSGSWFSYSSNVQTPYTSTVPFSELTQGYYYLYIGNSGLDELISINVHITSNNSMASIELLINDKPEPVTYWYGFELSFLLGWKDLNPRMSESESDALLHGNKLFY